MDTFLRLLWRAVCVGCCAGLSVVAFAQSCTPHDELQYRFVFGNRAGGTTYGPWAATQAAACTPAGGMYIADNTYTSSTSNQNVTVTMSGSASMVSAQCKFVGTITTVTQTIQPAGTTTTTGSGNLTFQQGSQTTHIDCTTCAGKTGVSDTASYTLGWSRVPGGSFPKNPTDAQLKSIVVGPAYWPSGSTCNKGCTATVGSYAQGYISTTPSASGLYRMSADFVVTGAGASCAAGATDGNNPTAPPQACDGFSGSINGKTSCIAPLGSPGGSANVPAGAVVGNPTADSSGSGPLTGREPTAANGGNGGNGGGPPTSLDGKPVGSDADGDGFADSSGGGSGTPSTDPCANNNFATGCYGTAPGQPSGLYTAKSRTFTQVFQQFQTTLSASGIGSGVANFFSVSFSASRMPHLDGPYRVHRCGYEHRFHVQHALSIVAARDARSRPHRRRLGGIPHSAVLTMPTYRVDFLSDLLGWLGELLKSAFAAAWNFVLDAAIAVLDAALQALASLIAAIPAPSFLAGGLTALFGGLGNDIAYILGATGFTAALALYGSGWAFRLARKFLTLFQW